MIKPNELRLGNLVCDEKGDILEVTTLDNDHAADHRIVAWRIKNKAFGCSDERLQPIPLTEEWL